MRVSLLQIDYLIYVTGPVTTDAGTHFFFSQISISHIVCTYSCGVVDAAQRGAHSHASTHTQVQEQHESRPIGRGTAIAAWLLHVILRCIYDT